MRKSPLIALDLMNAICCLLVILIHVLSLGISYANPSSWQAALIYFPWRIISFVVPAFLFTGAVKLGHRGGGDRYGHYIWARIKSVYLPYLLWTVIYFLSFIPIGYVRGEPSELIFYLLSGSITSPFYYIVIVMQFYLLRPIWLWVLKYVPCYVGILGAILLTFLCSESAPLLATLGIEFNYISSLAGPYLLFWVVGLYVGQHYDWVEAELLRHKMAILALSPLILLVAGLAYVQYRFGIFIYALNYFKIFVDCMDIMILLLICILISQHFPKLQRVLQWIHRSSFLVYLSHCLFLTHVTNWANAQGITNLSLLIFLRFAVCYTAPFFLYWIWSKRPSLPHIK